MSLNQSFHAALVAVLYLVNTTLTTTCNKKLECLKQLETYSVVLKWHTCSPVRFFTHVAPAVHLYSSNISVLIMRLGFFFLIYCWESYVYFAKTLSEHSLMEPSSKSTSMSIHVNIIE